MTPGQTDNTLEGLHISPGLGMPWDPPGGAEGRCRGEGCLMPPQPILDKRREMDGWMDG